MTRSAPEFVSRDDWLKARKALLDREKAFTKERDALTAARQAAPMVKIEKTYQFETLRGEETLSDLFRGKSQLVVQHFMFGKAWTEGCPSCSFWADNFNGIEPHLAARNISFVMVSTAPLNILQAYRVRMQWQFDWVSAEACDFNQDFGVTFPDNEAGPTNGYNYSGKVFGEEGPGLSTFEAFDDGSIGHLYSTYGRGLDLLNGAYNLMDITPQGRNEADLPFPQAWVRRKDQYG